MSLYELPHDPLVPALEGLFDCLDEPSFKKSPGDETLKTSFLSGPQTTHFLRDSCSQQNRPKNSSIKPIPPPDGDYSLPDRGGNTTIPPSDGYYSLPNQKEPLGRSDPRDIYGFYSEIFCFSTMTGDDEDANKVETTLTRSRSRTRSAPRSRPQPGQSILEVLNRKKDMESGNR